MRCGKSAEDIRRITIRTHEACLRIIDKKGPLANPADRDHCVQYMIAIPLIFGRLTAADYEDKRSLCRSAHRRAAREGGVRRRAAIHRAIITTRKSDRLPTRSASNWTMERCWKKRSSIRSGTSGGAKKECRCWWRSSRRNLRAAVRRGTAATNSRCVARSRAAGSRCR